MDTYPKLSTDRLRLGSISHKDIPTIVGYAGDAKISSTTLNLPHPYHNEDAIFWISSANQGYRDGSQYTFAIRLADSGAFIGGIGLRVDQQHNRAEMGYWIAVPFWNMGYATEAANAVIRFGFEEVGLNKILATYLVDNPASGKVMIKNGMIKEGELEEHTRKGCIYHSLIQYRLTRTEYENLL